MRFTKLPPTKNRPSPPPPYWVTANVIAFRQMFHLESLACYRSSQHDPKGLSLVLPPSAGDAELGAAAWAVLRAARFVAPGDPDWDMLGERLNNSRAHFDEHQRELLAAAGVKTLRTLYTGARMVSLARKGGQLLLYPWTREGYLGWTATPGESEDIYPDTLTEEELGRAIRKALARAVG